MGTCVVTMKSLIVSSGWILDHVSAGPGRNGWPHTKGTGFAMSVSRKALYCANEAGSCTEH